MLVKYDSNKEHYNYEEFYNAKVKEMICPDNDNYPEMIKDMIIDYMKAGTFDSAIVMDDIRSINCSISEQIAQVAIDEGVVVGKWCDDEDFYTFLLEVADEIIDTLFFSQDIMIGIQEMVYKTSKKYNLPVTMDRGIFFDYPEILEMYSEKGDLINSLPDDEDIHINANHAQIIMFDEFMDNEPSFYGRNNVLLYEEKEVNTNANLLEG